jgi:hypothetical protein
MANPVVIAVSPTVDEQFVDLYASIVLRVPLDVVDPWTIEVDRGTGFELALTYNAGATFEDDFDGDDSEVAAGATHYETTVDPVDPFSVLTEVTVRVTGQNGIGEPVVIA